MENTRINEIANSIAQENVKENKDSNVVAPKQRVRSMTTLKLQWLAERVRKCRNIKSMVASGTYHVDSIKVAKSILNLDMIEETQENDTK